jgi:hypothetical protein
MVRLVKRLWKIERDYRQLKKELGLDHYEGRNRQGRHHRVTMVMLAHVFLALEALRSRKNFWVDPAEDATRDSVSAVHVDRRVRLLRRRSEEFAQSINRQRSNTGTPAVRRAREADGGMGRYVGYAEGAQHTAFLRELFDFIRSGGKASQKAFRTKKGGGGRGWQGDPGRRERIEEAAVGEAMRYCLKLGCRIDDRQDEHCGWDLVPSKYGRVLYLEAKGVAGSGIAVDLTANE